MTRLRQQMIDEMRRRNFSPRTIDGYVRVVRDLARHFGKSPDQLGTEDLRQFQLYLIDERKSAWSTFNLAACALRFFYRQVLEREDVVERIRYGKLKWTPIYGQAIRGKIVEISSYQEGPIDVTEATSFGQQV